MHRVFGEVEQFLAPSPAPPGDEHGAAAGAQRVSKPFQSAPRVGPREWGGRGMARVGSARRVTGRLTTTVRRSRRAESTAPASSSTAVAGSVRAFRRADRARDGALVDIEIRVRRHGGRGEHNHGGAGFGGLGDSGDRVGVAAALVHAEHRHFPARARVRIGHRRGAALVAGGGEGAAGVGEGAGEVEVARADYPNPWRIPLWTRVRPRAWARVTVRPARAPGPGSPNR